MLHAGLRRSIVRLRRMRRDVRDVPERRVVRQLGGVRLQTLVLRPIVRARRVRRLVRHVLERADLQQLGALPGTVHAELLGAELR